MDFKTKFSENLISELSSRDINFYLYLVPIALVPWTTNKFISEPFIKTYLDIVVITIYTSVLWDNTGSSVS